MDYLIVFDCDSAIGGLMLSLSGKIGGASSTVAVKGNAHPLILGRDLDATSLPGFLKFVHLQNPGMPDPLPRQVIVPSQAVLFVHEFQPAPENEDKPAPEQSKKLH